MDKQYSATILVVEDEASITEMLKIGFLYEGYRVESAEDGSTALRILTHKTIDVIILDIMLPDIDGFKVCQSIRKRDSDIPIIMLTAKREIEDKVKGLNLGADDYLTKPFSFEELLARVRALLRRSRKKSAEEKVLRSGDISLNLESREVRKGEQEIHLTPTEFSLLELFMKHPKRVFSRESLLNCIWGYNHLGNTNILEVHISNLRKKLGDKEHTLIKAIYGIGYTFQPKE